METLVVFAIGILMTAVTILGDYLTKQASLQPGFEGWKFLATAALFWGASVFGWFFVFRNMKVSNVAVLYSMSGVIMLTLLGVIVFKEKLSGFEVLGLGMALCSLILLARFG